MPFYRLGTLPTNTNIMIYYFIPLLAFLVFFSPLLLLLDLRMCFLQYAEKSLKPKQAVKDYVDTHLEYVTVNP